MSNYDFLKQATTEAITRMSNLGMAIKTAGITLFGAGVVNYLNSSDSNWSCNVTLAYCLILYFLGFMFIFMDVSYLRRERAFREIQRLILEDKWTLSYLDSEIILKEPQKYQKTKFSKCLISPTILPIALFELLTIFFLYFLL